MQREDCCGEFQKKIFNDAEEIASLNMGGTRIQYSSINFLRQLLGTLPEQRKGGHGGEPKQSGGSQTILCYIFCAQKSRTAR